MKKKYMNIREMLRRFNDFVSSNQMKLDAIPVVKELITKMLSLHLTFEAAWAIREKNYKGTTLAKQSQKEDAALELARVNQLLYNYCVKNKELDDLPNFKGSQKTYAQYGDEHLISKLELSIAYCDDLGEQLADTGISAEVLTALKDASTAYINLAPRPKELQSTSKLANQELGQISLQITNTLRYRLDKVMKSMFEEDDPDLYKAYIEARDIEKVGHRKVSVMGHILDKRTQKPVPQAHILIPEAEIDHTCTGEKGGFRISSVEPGTFDMKIEAVTYKSINMQLVHRYGETNVLEIEMETEDNQA